MKPRAAPRPSPEKIMQYKEDSRLAAYTADVAAIVACKMGIRNFIGLRLRTTVAEAVLDIWWKRSHPKAVDVALKIIDDLNAIACNPNNRAYALQNDGRD